LASSREIDGVKEFVIEVPLRRGDMDATPQAFPDSAFAP